MKKISLILTLTFLVTTQLFAQEGKLQNIQATTGIASPVVKVDGNLKEWNDSFQAYNKQTKLFYTVSNDDQFLYLVVKSTDMQTSNKIVAGGITFTLNIEGKKKDKDAFTLTYPVIARPAGRGSFGGPGGGQRGGFGGSGGGFGDRKGTLDSATLAARHKQTITAAKEIKVFGFKDITDTLISIYNEYRIKAAIDYDAAGNYCYELAVPLKLLNLAVGSSKEIAYNVKVNGITMPNFGPRDGGGDDHGGFGGGSRGGEGGGRGGFGSVHGDPGRQDGADMFSATDFWGKYMPAKKY